MTDVARLAMQISVNGARRAQSTLTSIQTGAVRLTKATEEQVKAQYRLATSYKSMNAAAARTAPIFKLQKGAVQQAGFQIQDFAVQVGSGQSALVAFGQQGSQLAGILGPGGAVLGAVIAIGSALGGVLFSSLMSGKSAAEELTTAMDQLGDVLERTDDSSLALTDRIRELARVSRVAAQLELQRGLIASRDAANQAREAIEELAESELDTTIVGDFQGAIGQAARLIRLGKDMEEAFDEAGGSSIVEWREGLMLLRDESENLNDEFGITEKSARGLISAIAKQRLEPGVESFQALQSALFEASQSSQNVSGDFVKFASTLSGFASQAVEAIKRGEEIDQIMQNFEETLTSSDPKLVSYTDKVKELSEAFRVQADTQGLNARETALYQLEQLEANGAQIEAVDAARKQINASFDKIDAYKREQEQLRLLREQYKVTAADDPLLQRVAAQERGKEIINKEAIERVKEYEKALESLRKELDPVGDAFDEFARKSELLDKALESEDISSEKYRKLKTALVENFANAGDEGADELQKALDRSSDRIASSLQSAIASGDWQGLGQQVGGTIAGEIGGAVSTGLSSALESSLGAAAGPLGAVGGAVVGGIIGGILGGKTTTVSKQLNFAIENALVSGFEQVTINTERFFGSSTKRISEELSAAITGTVQNSFDMTARDIGSSLRSIGLDYENSVDAFSFTLEDTNPADFVGEAANEFLRESTVVAEVYQRAGETMVDAIARIADDFEVATRAFTVADVDISQFVENLSVEIGDTLADNLDQIQQRISAKQAEIAGRELELTETGGGATGAAAETRIKGQLRTLNRELDNLLERQAEQSDRLAEAANIAAVGLRENLIAAVAELSNTSTEQALSNLSGLTSSLESLRFSEPEILQRQIDTARESLSEFTNIGIDASAPLADIIQQLRDFGPQTAEDTAALLVAAGHVDSLKTATEGLAQAAEDAFMDLTSSTDEALNRLRASIREERERATDAYSAEQDAIRQATDARLEANKLATDAAKEGLSAIQSEVRGIESALEQLRGAFDPIQQMRRESALDLLRNALATGDLAGTGDAAGIAGQIDSAGFATRADFEREQGRTLNLLSDLEDTGEIQLTTAERSLRELEAQTQVIKASGDAQLSALEQMHDSEMARLDRTLEDAQSQIELLRGIDNSVLSVAEAINRLSDALGRETTSRVQDAYARFDQPADAEGVAWWESEIAAGRATIADLEYQIQQGQARQSSVFLTDEMRFPEFADGGIASGPNSGYPVTLHGSEAVIPLSGGAVPVRMSGGGNGEMVEEIRKLRRELMEAQRAIARTNQRLADNSDRIEVFGVKIRDEADIV